MALHVAIADLSHALFIVTAVELDHWREDSEELTAGRAFDEIALATARTACRQQDVNLVVRCAVGGGEVRIFMIFSSMMSDLSSENALRTMVNECIDRWQIWGAKPLAREELDLVLALDPSWDAVRLTKPKARYASGPPDLLLVTRVSEDPLAWTALLPVENMTIDYGIFPMEQQDLVSQLRRSSAISTVLARRALEASVPLKQNAAAIEFILKQEVFAGTAITLTGPGIASAASHIAIYEHLIHSAINGQYAWQVRPGEMDTEQLGFMVLDYSQEREQLELIEPDLRSTFRLARGVAESMSAYQARPPLHVVTIPQADERPFDVFLSHNSKDKPTVRRLADALEGLGVKVWLDERELVPGRKWQEALEEIIQQVKCAAVLFGPSGLGPWEAQEMRGCLLECVDRGLPVIPILLPGAPRQPQLPLFLRQFTWIDLRRGLDRNGLSQLVWGVTGVKPTPS